MRWQSQATLLKEREFYRIAVAEEERLSSLVLDQNQNLKDAYEKIRAGASLVEVWTGMIYEGPFIVQNINRGLLRLLERDGFGSIADAVGTE